MSTPHRNKDRPLRLPDLWSRRRPNISSLTSAISSPLVSSSCSHSLVDCMPQQISCLRSSATRPSVLFPHPGSTNVSSTYPLIVSSVDSSNNSTSPPRSEGGSVSSFPLPPFSLTATVTNLDSQTAHAPRAAPGQPTPRSSTPNQNTSASTTGIGGLSPEGNTAPTDEDHADPMPGGSDRPQQGRGPTMRATRTEPASSPPSPPPGEGPDPRYHRTTTNAMHRCLPGPLTCSLLSPSDLPQHHDPSGGASPPASRKRPLTLHDFWCPDRPPKTRTRPPPTCHCPAVDPYSGRRRSREQPEGDRPSKIPRPSVPTPTPNHGSPHLSPPPHPRVSAPPPSPLSPLTAEETSLAEVQFMGPSGPLELQVVSPSGDVRLTLRRYSPLDLINSPHLFFRMDLRIQPKDLYSIFFFF